MPARFRLLRWVPVFCWMAVIFMGSTDALSAAHTSRFIGPLLLFLFPHISAETLDLLHLCIRKAGHLTEYGVLSILLWRAVPVSRRDAEGADWRRAGMALAIAACYGATDEFHQTFVPSRGASVHDVLIDSCGAAITLTAVALLCRGKRSAECSPARVIDPGL
jgi:VanZ family protein